MTDIGKRIRNRRLELDLSVEDVAKQLNKNRTTVYRYEKGDIENLPLETLKPLAEILDTTPAYLMGWSDKTDTESKDDSISQEDYLLKSNFVAYVEMFEEETFTDEEYGKILEYAKFLVYMRKTK